MKTTVEISDPVLREAKEAARREGSTLRALVEEGLRLALERREGGEGFRLRDASVDGRGLRAELQGASWDALRAGHVRASGSTAPSPSPADPPEAGDRVEVPVAADHRQVVRSTASV